MVRYPPVVIAIIAVNLALYAFTYYLPGKQDPSIDALALHYPGNELMRPWQFASHIFMHGGPAHILFNLMGIYMFGSALESVWGSRRFLAFFMAAGTGAGLIYSLVNVLEFGALNQQLLERGVAEESIQRFLDTGRPDSALFFASEEEARNKLLRIFYAPMLGASGALYGILVAFAFLFPNVKLALIFLPMPIAAKYFVPLVVLFDLISEITGFSLFGGGIAHIAHIGGGAHRIPPHGVLEKEARTLRSRQSRQGRMALAQ